MSYELLFSPMKIGKVEIKNRIVQTSMGVDISNPDGTISDRAIAYYAERARNGVGLIITEYTRINEKDGVSAVGQPSLATDRHIEGMARLIRAVHEGGAKIFVQLQHPGRQTVPIFPTFWPSLELIGKVFPAFWDKYNEVVGKATEGGVQGGDPEAMKKQQKLLKPNLAPSKLPENEPDVALWYVKHRAMTVKEIHRIEQQFFDAAVRAKKAGADGVELHATHGYLLQQFLSPFTNRRTDEYGGSFENRCRIVKELIEGVKHVCGQDFPVSIRLTVDEFEDKIGHPERGYHLDEGVRFAKEFEKYGADAINVSIGATDTIFLYQESLRYPLGWRKYMSKAVKEAVSIPVIAVGVIRTPSQAEQQLQEGDQDFIGLARPLLADPQWVLKAKEGREDEISRCVGCLRCVETVDQNMLTTKPPECSLNPRLCRETEFSELPIKDGNGKSCVVVGAGPGGLTAARELALRGFKVTVFEKDDAEGGQLNIANKPPQKDRLLWAANDLKVQAERAGADIRFNTEATAEMIAQLHPRFVIVATGGVPVHPRFPGADASYVCTAKDVLLREVSPIGQDVVIVGSGLTGLETADLLTTPEYNNRVTVVEMDEQIAPGVSSTLTQELIPHLRKCEVTFVPGHKLEKIENNTVVLAGKDEKRKVLPAEVVVLSTGTQSVNHLYDELKARSIPVYKIGDAKAPGRIVNAVRDGYMLARTI